MKYLRVLVICIGIIACNIPAAVTPSAAPPPASTTTTAATLPPPSTTTTLPLATRQPTATPLPQRSTTTAALVEQVSTTRLMTDVEALAAFHTRHVNSGLRNEAAAYIYQQFETTGLAVTYQEFPLSFEETFTTQRNVIATLPGTGPGVIIVGAHYDSRTIDYTDPTGRAPGANDNATGVAAIIEMARLLADTQPEHTIRFVAFAAEEVGIVGSRTYVQRAVDAGEDIRAVLILDIIGNAAGDAGEGSIRVFSAPPNDTPSRRMARYIDVMSEQYIPGFSVNVQPTVDRPRRYSDHVPFSDAGFPAARLIEPIENLNRQHSALDLPQYISPGYLARSTGLAMAVIHPLAMASPPPGGLVAEEGVLRWSPVEGAAGYVVALRASPEALVFREVLFVGPHTQIGLDGVSGYVSVASLTAEGEMGLFSPEITVLNVP